MNLSAAAARLPIRVQGCDRDQRGQLPDESVRGGGRLLHHRLYGARDGQVRHGCSPIRSVNGSTQVTSININNNISIKLIELNLDSLIQLSQY